MTTEHIVKSFDADLAQIEALIMEMGGLVEKQLADATTALLKRNVDLADEVIEGDSRIDQLESDVDNKAIEVLALRQPMAEDLRAVVGSMKIAGNLERIGDYSKNIAKRTGTLAQGPALNTAAGTIRRMSELVHEMISAVLDAFGRRDALAAEDVRASDEEVDQLHNTLFRELLTYMMEDPRSISGCMHLLFIAKNIERMGDHTTSIAEQVVFMTEGSVPAEDRAKGDRTSFTLLDPP